MEVSMLLMLVCKYVLVS